MTEIILGKISYSEAPQYCKSEMRVFAMTSCGDMTKNQEKQKRL